MSRLKNLYVAIRDTLLYILLFLASISYHPTLMRISHLAGYENGTVLSKYIMIVFIIVLFMSVNLQIIQHSRLVRRFIIWLGIISLFSFAIWTLFNNREMISDVRTLIIVLGSIMIGFDLKGDKKHFTTLILVYSLTSLFSGIMQIFVNIGGFRIIGMYLADSKNSLGAMLASASLSFFYLSKDTDKRWLKGAFLALTVLALIVIVTIRARMALVTIVLVGMYYYYLIDKGRNIISVFILGFLSLLLVLIIPNFVFDYIEASFVSGTQAEDFTSGRIETYLDALSYLSQHPLLGNTSGLNHIGWVHNYILLKLYEYGLLFSWPIIVLYFIVLLRGVSRSMYSNSPLSRECFGYVCLLIPFVISLAEPTFPFGPGTVAMYNFILLGMAEKIEAN